jgi:hypothetical protein
MQTVPNESPITAAEAEAFVPPLDKFVGNKSLSTLLTRWTARPITHDGNLCVVGPPGTAKTTQIQSYIGHQLNNPYMFREHLDPQRRSVKSSGRNRMPVDQDREWHATPEGRIFFKQINGATDSKDLIAKKLEEVQYALFADHAILLVDEIGELYFQGYDEMLRPVLTEPAITVYATAQNFHSKRRTDTANETDDRLSALMRRFSHIVSTELPTPKEHLEFLVYLVKAWTLKIDRPDTLRLLVDKSRGIVGWSKRIMIRAIDSPDRRLTYDLVDAADVDPR